MDQLEKNLPIPMLKATDPISVAFEILLYDSRGWPDMPKCGDIRERLSAVSHVQFLRSRRHLEPGKRLVQIVIKRLHDPEKLCRLCNKLFRILPFLVLQRIFQIPALKL